MPVSVSSPRSHTSVSGERIVAGFEVVDLPNGTLNLPGCLAPNMLVSSVHAGQRSSISFPNGRVERHGSQADGSTCRISICRERPRRSASLRKNRQCGLAPTANGHNGARHKTARALTRGNRTLDPNGPTGYVGSHISPNFRSKRNKIEIGS